MDAISLQFIDLSKKKKLKQKNNQVMYIGNILSKWINKLNCKLGPLYQGLLLLMLLLFAILLTATIAGGRMALLPGL